jgi:hypothetical protein
MNFPSQCVADCIKKAAQFLQTDLSRRLSHSTDLRFDLFGDTALVLFGNGWSTSYPLVIWMIWMWDNNYIIEYIYICIITYTLIRYLVYTRYEITRPIDFMHIPSPKKDSYWQHCLDLKVSLQRFDPCWTFLGISPKQLMVEEPMSCR